MNPEEQKAFVLIVQKLISESAESRTSSKKFNFLGWWPVFVYALTLFTTIIIGWTELRHSVQDLNDAVVRGDSLNRNYYNTQNESISDELKGVVDDINFNNETVEGAFGELGTIINLKQIK